MTEPRGPEDGFDLDELAGYLDELQFGVDAHVTEARLLGLRAQAVEAVDPALDCSVLDDPVIHPSAADIADGAVTTPVAPANPTAANPHAQAPDRWPGVPSPLPVPPLPVPPLPVPPIPLPPLPVPPLPVPPIPLPPLPTEPVPAPLSSTPPSSTPPSSTPAWREP